MKKVIIKFLEFVSKYKSYIIVVIIFIASGISLVMENSKNKNNIIINDNEIVNKKGLIAGFISLARKLFVPLYHQSEFL